MLPERRAVALLAAWVAASVAASLRPDWLFAALAAGGLALAVLALDALRARALPPLELRRTVAGTLALRNWTSVTLRIESGGGLRLEIFDHHPPCGEATGLPARVVLRAGEPVEVTYRFRPLARGAWRFEPAEVRIDSPWGFWKVRRRVGEPNAVRVYPDFGTVQRFAILAVDNAVSRLGVRRRQRRGEGLELLQLREYREGDSLRQIDWKATSRRLRIISREYETERNQQVVFLLDCGRSMRAVDDGLPHFDHVLNSVLLLTYVAVRQGDAVGLMTMGGRERWLPPQKGPAALGRMMQSIYDLETGTQVPDLLHAARALMTHQRRRALVVIVSNVRDEDGDELAAALGLMRRRHLVLLASLREAVLDAGLESRVQRFDDALRVGALHHYLGARRRCHETLRGRGVHLLDVTPGRLPLALVNRYLDVKLAGTL